MNNRRVLAAIAVIGMLVCSFPVLAIDQDSEAGSSSGVLIYQVSSKSDEFDSAVTIINNSSSTINLNGYYVTDSEGRMTFTSDRDLASGATVTLAISASYHPAMKNVIVAGESGTSKSGTFNAVKSGDDIHLFDGSGNVLDSVCYGDKTITDTSRWTGEPVPRANNCVIQRVLGTDTDSAADWKAFGSLGLDFDSDLQYEATVTPFLFPNDGGIPIYMALEEATESIHLCLYQFSSKNLYAKLIELAEDGIEVKVLIDGGSLGWTGNSMARDLGYMDALQDAGAEIRLINGTDYDRYQYVHAKYCIIDGDTTIVTSENWTAANCNGSVTADDKIYTTSGKGNRGWGAVVESTGYAGYMEQVFQNDFSMDYFDVVTLNTFMAEKTVTDPGIMVYTEPSYSKEFPNYTATVTPMVSFDNSLDAETYYISNATERVYNQQQSLSTSYYDVDGSLIQTNGPLKALQDAASDTAVDVRFIISLGTTSDDSDRIEGVVDMLNGQTLIKAAGMEDPYVHNKGLVCDDSVIVTSVNWTPTSFNSNRESGVIIHSEQVADYFAAAFTADFDRVYAHDGIRASITEYPKDVTAGTQTTMTVDVLPVGESYTYTWDFGDGSEVRTTEVGRVSFTAVEGTHTVTVTVVNTADPTQTCTVSMEYTILPEGSFDISFIKDNITYLIPIIVIILGIIIKVIRR